jgi:hypothetical protein
MASQGTPHDGLDDIASLAYTSGLLTLVAYTNSPDSLGSATVVSDLTQPTSANGYAPILLDGTWSSNNGVLTYVHSDGANNFNDHPGWQASGTWSGTVNGVAIIRTSGLIVRHFKDLAAPFTAANLKKLVSDLSTVVV